MKRLILTSCLCVLIVTGTAMAHWLPEDGHKMHWPQLPDPYGWDIDMTNFVLADDWQCSATGPVKDIHFWYSTEQDSEFPPFFWITVSIHDDVPAGVDAPYSHPGNQLWSRVFLVTPLVTPPMVAGPWEGEQGWDDPTQDSPCRYPDHYSYWQLNITDINEPFIQEEGKIYWLDLQFYCLTTELLVGWKTTMDPFGDRAVYQDSAAAVGWSPIAVCTANMPTDLAFVITPEPATIALLGFGALSLLRRKR